MEVFGSSGVRGIVGAELTPEFVGAIVAAAGSELAADTIAIGRDTRTTGPLLADAAASHLAAIGCTVHRLGIVPTPGIQAYAEANEIPAVIITASHNPPEYNGIKLIGPDGIELPIETLEAIEDRYQANSIQYVTYDAVGQSVQIDSVCKTYRAQVLDAFPDAQQAAIADANLTVALDPGHGAGSFTSPKVLRELGVQVITVNNDPDGTFPGRNPEPTEQTLSDLSRLVRTSAADMGIAHDGDADRAIFIDETGTVISGEASLAALAAATIAAGDTVVSAVNVSQRLADVVDAKQATLELTPIGSTYLISRIRDLTAAGERVSIAGEGNGGIMFPAYRIARDGAYTMLQFLHLITEEPASSVVAPYDDYFNARVNLRYDTLDERDTMLQAAETFVESADVEYTTIDGYRLEYGDAWVLVRPSGTEPLVRIYAEARSHARAQELVETVESAVAIDSA